MAVTNDKQIAKKMNLFRNHGITKNKDLMINKNGVRGIMANCSWIKL